MKNSKREFNLNIYGQKTEGELFKTFNLVHIIFKYKFWLPVLHIANYMFKKHDEKKYLDLLQHQNLKILDNAYEDALETWTRKFLKATYDKNNTWTEDHIKNVIKNGSSQKSLRIMKKLLLMMCQNDTAYLEFYNILSHKLTEQMCDHYKDKKSEHLFYTSKSISDFRYFAIQNSINGDMKNGKQ